MTLAAVLATGAGLFGSALGGMSGVDGALRAASAPPPTRMVVHRVEADRAADGRCAPPGVVVSHERPPRV